VTRLILIRHGETGYSERRRFCGSSDPPLSPRGIEQAHKIRERFNGVGINAVFSSDLLRARRTADIAFSGHDAGVTVSRALRELSFGVYEGLTHEELLSLHGESYMRWIEDPTSSTPPEGETLASLDKRARCFIDGELRDYEEKVVVLVSHGGPIRAIVGRALGIRGKAILSFSISLGSITIVDRFRDVFAVRTLNNTGHLGLLEELEWDG